MKNSNLSLWLAAFGSHARLYCRLWRIAATDQCAAWCDSASARSYDRAAHPRRIV